MVTKIKEEINDEVLRENPKNQILNLPENDEKVFITNEENLTKNKSKNSKTNGKTNRKIVKVIITVLKILAILIFLIILAFLIFTIYNIKNNKINNGILIRGIDVSNLTISEAKKKVEEVIKNETSEDIIIFHEDYETSICLEQINAKFDIDLALQQAYLIGRDGNFLENDYKVIDLYKNKENIELEFSLDKNALNEFLENVSTQLPDIVVESSYYIEKNNLIITPGTDGVAVDVDKMSEYIISKIKDFSYSIEKLDIITKNVYPKKIDIQKIHDEIYINASNAYYTSDPYIIYPSINGRDFKITIDEANKMLETKQEEYIIPLKTIYPEIATNDLGFDAFPDLIASFSTKYAISNKDRTTNLKLASDKVNGTVLLPGEVFSYNKIVGERTIAKGYKEAAIYQDGKVVNGIGGGICQVSSTLFNTVLFANLKIEERRNHQFIPSYVTAGRDATVVYGSQDFKFKNTRNYAIKILSSVSNGICKVEIYGLKEQTEYDVEIDAKVTSKTSKYIKSKTYRILKQNGQEIKTELIASDTYKIS